MKGKAHIVINGKMESFDVEVEPIKSCNFIAFDEIWERPTRSTETPGWELQFCRGLGKVKCTIPFGVRVTVRSVEHPIDLYDRMTERGYRLNLVDGRWYQPIVAQYNFVQNPDPYW